MRSLQPQSHIVGRKRVPPSRRLVCDVLKFSRQVPSCAHDRLMFLGDLADVRDGAAVRISWPVLFIKAFAITSLRFPRLLQTWRRWPWPHIYQHASPVALIATRREFQSDDWLFWSRFISPHRIPLPQLQSALDRYQAEPVDQVFRQQWQLSHLPAPLRHWIWWYNMQLAGEKRAKRMGTFILTTVGSQGVEMQHPPALLTATLTYGPVRPDGTSRVTLIYDHRLMDGSYVADCLQELELQLQTTIASELRDLEQTADSVSEAA